MWIFDWGLEGDGGVEFDFGYEMLGIVWSGYNVFVMLVVHFLKIIDGPFCGSLEMVYCRVCVPPPMCGSPGCRQYVDDVLVGAEFLVEVVHCIAGDSIYWDGSNIPGIFILFLDSVNVYFS